MERLLWDADHKKVLSPAQILKLFENKVENVEHRQSSAFNACKCDSTFKFIYS